VARNEGEAHRHGQVLVRKTPDVSPNRDYAKVWVSRCPIHGEYKAKSCDFHVRRCPEEGGKPGFP